MQVTLTTSLSLVKRETPELWGHLGKVQTHASDTLLSTSSLRGGGTWQQAKQTRIPTLRGLATPDTGGESGDIRRHRVYWTVTVAVDKTAGWG